MKSADEARTMVKEAAEELDGLVPGWADAVNLLELNMNDCRKCVLGQVGTNLFELTVKVTPYDDMFYRLFGSSDAYEQMSDNPFIPPGEYEFDFESDECRRPAEYDEVMDAYDDEWAKQITKRKALTAMDIGKEEKTKRIEPIEEPVPNRKEQPAEKPLTAPTPDREPEKAPEREPVKTDG